ARRMKGLDVATGRAVRGVDAHRHVGHAPHGADRVAAVTTLEILHAVRGLAVRRYAAPAAVHVDERPREGTTVVLHHDPERLGVAGIVDVDVLRYANAFFQVVVDVEPR